MSYNIPNYNFIKELDNYTDILYDHEFNIIMEGTSLFLIYNDISNNFTWTYGNINEINVFFKFIPLDSNGNYYKDKLNKPISSNDTFVIIYNNSIVLKVSNYNNITQTTRNEIQNYVS